MQNKELEVSKEVADLVMINHLKITAAMKEAAIIYSNSENKKATEDTRQNVQDSKPNKSQIL